ncbi:MAG: universal stress protein [Cellulosilyticaceae bacterium]
MADRLTPSEALKLANEEGKGSLKIFIGYAPGVGKTYTMLNEANRRFKRGDNINIGYLETHERAETLAQVDTLPIIPRKKIAYNDHTFEEMDTDSIIRIHPKLVLVDELAHTNVPGSKNKKRYEDVIEILEAGINVYSTMNIQHIESLNDVVQQITGIIVRETVPDSIVQNADEIVLVDITPDSLRNRLLRGDIYKKDLIEKSLNNFFRKGNLNALRELALRQTAYEVDEDLEAYMKAHEIKENWAIAERVMVSISSSPNAKRLIRRGFRLSQRLKCEFYVTYVTCTRLTTPSLSDGDKKSLEENLLLAEKLGAEVIPLKGHSISHTLVNFATEKHITKLIIGHSKRSFWQTLVRGSTVNKILKLAKDIEIMVVPM